MDFRRQAAIAWAGQYASVEEASGLSELQHNLASTKRSPARSDDIRVSSGSEGLFIRQGRQRNIAERDCSIPHFARHRGALCHIKDQATDGTPVPIGTGTLDIKSMITAADATGMEHYLVEVDQHPDPLEAIRISIGYLRDHIG